jgi:hypothetical protein
MGGVVDAVVDVVSDVADFAIDYAAPLAVSAFAGPVGAEFLVGDFLGEALIGDVFTDVVGDIGFDVLGDFASDGLGDAIWDFGGDFVADFGYEAVGDFAGSADWFDLVSPGDMFDISSVTEFADYGSFTDFADIDFGDINFGDVNTDFGGFDFGTDFGDINFGDTFTDIDFTDGGLFTEISPGVYELTADIQVTSISDTLTSLQESVLGPIQLGGPGAGGFIDTVKNSVTNLLPTNPDQLVKKITDQATKQIVTTGIKTAAGAVSQSVSKIPVVGQIAGQVINTAANQTVRDVQLGRTIQGPAGSGILDGITRTVGNVVSAIIPSAQAATVSQTGIRKGTVTVQGFGGPVQVQNPRVYSATTVSGGTNPQVDQFGFIETETGLYVLPEDVPADVDPNQLIEFGEFPSEASIDRSAAEVGYTTSYDVESGSYVVVNKATGEIVQGGLTEEQANSVADEQTAADSGNYDDVGPGQEGPTRGLPGDVRPNSTIQIAYDDDGNLLPGYTLDEDNNPIFVGGDFVEPATQALADEARITALSDLARQQQTIRTQRSNQAQSGDWRVRLRLAPNSNYLYNAPNAGPVLWPLQITDGVIFPYTPTIDIGYKANYAPYDLTHSNYRGYFYQNSFIDAINIKGTFTAQDTQEANYLLAVIHFFRSCTKMFYGQDAQRGSPPPLCYLSGFGDYQFAEHPVVVTQFNYNLPSDVNYIRAQSVNVDGTNLLGARNRQTSNANPLSYALKRLLTIGASKGGLDNPISGVGSLGADNPTYVPTKIDINLILLPMQSRAQVSKQFSVKEFASGNLLKGGFW